MKSLEALENWYNTESPRTKAYEYEQHYRLIKKDLEILEILKKGFSKNFLAERLKDAYLRNDLNDEDYEKIENWEWLEK